VTSPSDAPAFLTADGPDCLLHVRVIPRAARDGLGPARAGALVVRLAAPPVDDAANRALVRFVADRLGVATRTVSVAAGERSRTKRVRIAGLTPGEVAARLERWPDRGVV